MNLLTFILPHPKNNHRAHALHPLSFLIISAIFASVQLALFFAPWTISTVSGFSSSITPEQIIELTNQKRQEKGLETLKTNSSLTSSALSKGADMLARDYWAHNSPDGKEPWHFFNEAGYMYRFAGENLARDFQNSEDVVSAWVASPTHRENLLSPKYEEIGIAVVEGELDGRKSIVVVQHFGTKMRPVADTGPTTPPTLNVVESTKKVLSSDTVKLFSVSRALALGVVGFFIGVFALDMLLLRSRPRQESSRSSAHVIFLFLILAIVLITKSGVIS